MAVTLARDPNNNPFELPEGAAFWRVRRHTRGRPSTVVGPDGSALYVAIDADRVALRAAGCSGSLRLEAVDRDHEPVDAPVAFVELGDDMNAEAQRTPPALDGGDLVRTSFESMTRTMEAMQRAQVERERALAQREKAITDVQVATSRMHVDVMTAVLDRFGGGKAQDPLAVLKQQLAFQKTITESARNAGMVSASEIAALRSDDKETDKEENPDQPPWLQAALAAAPLLIGVLSKGDPATAAILQQAVSGVTSAVGQASAGAQSSEEPSRPTPRVIRQVLADLDDEEADTFETYFVDLDANAADRLAQEAARQPSHERAKWARSVLSHAKRTNGESEGSQITLGLLPAELGPLLAQLNPDELQLGVQVVSALDEATIKRLASKLLAMPSDKALQTVRRLIDESRRRRASVAHRAVMSVLDQPEVTS